MENANHLGEHVYVKIFICWSGERSHSLATALQTWLPKFIPGLEAVDEPPNLFVSDEIVKGVRWFDVVDEQLDTSDAGVVCVTREALQSGWIHFEAGALARAVRKNERQKKAAGALYTYLLGVESSELRGPLSEFQATKFEREDNKKLCGAIVNCMKKAAPTRGIWEKAFDENWGSFEKQVNTIKPLPAEKLIPGLEEMFRRKTFNEPLEECTRQAWIDRFTGVRETIAGLKTYAAVMKTDNSYLLDLYNELLSQLDGYAMNMGALLLQENHFQVSPENGKLVIGAGIKRACESRRATIRQLVTHLLAPNCGPVLENESRRYAKTTSFEAKKTIMIHPAEREIQETWDGKKTSKASEEKLKHCAASLWEFDRIYYYLVQEKSVPADFGQLLENLEQEFENLRAVDGAASLIPLHYVIRALKRVIARSPVSNTLGALSSGIESTLTRIEQFLSDYELDKGHQVRENIQELRSYLNDTTNDCAAQPKA